MRAEELSRLGCGLYTVLWEDTTRHPSSFTQSLCSSSLTLYSCYFSRSSFSLFRSILFVRYAHIYSIYLTTGRFPSFSLASLFLYVLILLQPLSCFTFLIQVILYLPISPFAFRYQDVPPWMQNKSSFASHSRVQYPIPFSPSCCMSSLSCFVRAYKSNFYKQNSTLPILDKQGVIL